MRRLLLGISGVPGAGKSTFAARLASQLGEAGVTAVAIAMDGFHLPDAVLHERGLMASKGAPSTFDRDAFEDLLRRLRVATVEVTAPGYSRELHAVVPDAVRVPAAAQVVLVEGNYLGFWPTTAALLDEVWRIDIPWEVARERLIARRIATGRDAGEARAWVDTVDAANARLVADSYATRTVTAQGR